MWFVTKLKIFLLGIEKIFSLGVVVGIKEKFNLVFKMFTECWFCEELRIQPPDPLVWYDITQSQGEGECTVVRDYNIMIPHITGIGE